MRGNLEMSRRGCHAGLGMGTGSMFPVVVVSHDRGADQIAIKRVVSTEVLKHKFLITSLAFAITADARASHSGVCRDRRSPNRSPRDCMSIITCYIRLVSFVIDMTEHIGDPARLRELDIAVL